MALAAGPIEYALPGQNRRLAPCRSHIRLAADRLTLPSQGLRFSNMQDSQNDNRAADSSSESGSIRSGRFDRRRLLEDYPYITFLLPFLVFGLLTSLEPTEATSGGSFIGLAIPYSMYPWVYTLKIALTIGSILFVLPGYRKFPWRVSPLAVGVGVVGVVLWVGICSLQLEQNHLKPLLDTVGLGSVLGSGTRSAFNPLEALAPHTVGAWSFLLVRFAGLALVLPIIEEFFLRGFLMRFVVDNDWAKLPIGQVNRAAVLVGTIVPMLMHPAELLAAAVWFSMVTWLLVKTRNIWDCVTAHAVTNLLLGIDVVVSGEWHLM